MIAPASWKLFMLELGLQSGPQWLATFFLKTPKETQTPQVLKKDIFCSSTARMSPFILFSLPRCQGSLHRDTENPIPDGGRHAGCIWGAAFIKKDRLRNQASLMYLRSDAAKEYENKYCRTFSAKKESVIRLQNDVVLKQMDCLIESNWSLWIRFPAC